MNRTQIKATARKKLGEATAVFFSEPDLNQWAEDAQLDIVWKTRCKRQRSLATTVADTVRYTLNALVPNILRVNSVRVYNGSTEKWRRIEQRTQAFLDQMYPEWLSADAGEPNWYVADQEQNEFILYPKADTDYVGTQYLEIYNNPKPTAMATDDSSPDLPQALHPAIIDYIVATGYEARGYQDIANTHWQMYQGKLTNYQSMRDVQEDEDITARPVYP